MTRRGGRRNETDMLGDNNNPIAEEEKQSVKAGILRLTHIPEFHCYAKMKSDKNIYTGKHTRDASE